MIANDILLSFNRVKEGKKNLPSSGSLMDDSAETMPTLFIGKDVDPFDELHLTTFSHMRFYKNSHESELAEISYYVEADPNDEQNMILFKRESKRIDDSPLEGGQINKLAEYLTFFNIRYWDCKNEKYVDSWDSVESIDYKNKFPEAVEIKIGLDDFKGGERIFETVAHVKMPNNLRRRKDVKIATSQDATKLTLTEQGNCEKCKADKTSCPEYCPTDKTEGQDKKNKTVEPLLIEQPSGSCSQ